MKFEIRGNRYITHKLPTKDFLFRYACSFVRYKLYTVLVETVDVKEIKGKYNNTIASASKKNLLYNNVELVFSHQ